MLMDEVLMMRLFGGQLWVMFRVGGTLCRMFLDPVSYTHLTLPTI